MQRPAVAGFPRGEVVEIPIEVAAVVLDAVAEAVGLGDENIAGAIEGEGGGCGEFLVFEIRVDLEGGAGRDGGAGDHGGAFQSRRRDIGGRGGGEDEETQADH